MSIKTLILLNLFASLVVIVAAVPVGKFLTSKNVEWIDDDADDVYGDGRRGKATAARQRGAKTSTTTMNTTTTTT